MEINETGQRSVYANLTNDYMFKRIFGSEECKDILINFLNRIVGNGEIEDVTFQNTEHLGPTAEDRKAVFDIAVRTHSGEEYIIEMQLAQQAYFRERALFHTSYPIMNQAALAKERYRKEHGEGWRPERYHSSYRLREDETGELLHDKLQFIFMELARFDKKEDELKNYYDKWMYLFKNMPYLKGRPKVFDEKEFDRLFDVAELCNFTPEQYSSYQNSQKMIYDYENTIDFARKQGREEGLAEGEAKGREEERYSMVKKMAETGLPLGLIVSITGLTENQIKTICNAGN